MQEIKTSVIKVLHNPRKDFKNIEELAASIKAAGKIIEPLIITKNNELVAGERRLRAAKLLGMEKVPVEYCSEDEKVEIQLIENIQRESLTAEEEGQAFSDWLKKNKGRSVETLADKIGKTANYIKRRLSLLNLTDKCKKALKEKKIELGHANLLSQMKQKQQDVALKEIIEWDLTVQNFSDQIRWLKIDFGDLKFRQDDSRYEKQTILTNIGKETEPKEGNYDFDNFSNNPAFKAEFTKYVEEQRKILRDKGITVFNSEKEMKEKHPEAKEIYPHDENWTKIVNSLPKSKEHAVVLDVQYGGLVKDVYRLTKKEEKKEKGKEPTEKERKEAEKVLNQTRKEKLHNRASEYKRRLLLSETTKLAKPGTTQIKALLLHELIRNFPFDVKSKFQDRYNEGHLKALFKADGKELDETIHKYAEQMLHEVICLETTTDAFGLKLENCFKMDDDWLRFHTKEQLIKLAREQKINTAGLEKKSQLMKKIKENWPVGKVPKLLASKLEV